jgi:hypothetical protein
MKRTTACAAWLLLLLLLLLAGHWRLALLAHSGHAKQEQRHPLDGIHDSHTTVALGNKDQALGSKGQVQGGAAGAVARAGAGQVEDSPVISTAGYGATFQHLVHNKAERATAQAANGTGSSSSSSQGAGLIDGSAAGDAAGVVQSQPTLKDSGPSSNSTGSTSSTGSGATVSDTSISGGVQPSILAPVLLAHERAKTDPVYREKLRQAAAKPINIAVMTSLFWGLPVEGTKGCSVDGIPLDCHIQNGGTTVCCVWATQQPQQQEVAGTMSEWAIARAT